MTRFSLIPLVALAAMVGQSQPLFAQTSGAFKGLEGRKVRITSALVEDDDRRGALSVQGTVFEIRGDSILVLQDGGSAAHLPLSSLRTLHVYGGKDHAKGAYKGALVGSAFGLFFTFMSEPDCDGNGYGFDCRADGSKPNYAEYVASNTAAFAFFGAIYGAIRGVDRWDPVITQQRVTIAPAKGGFRVGMKF